MNFYQMEIFLEVVKLRSVTKAAKKLLLSQPAVTIHIRKLENEINCRLLNTKRGNYSLTPEGKRFFRFAEYVSREKQKFFSDIANMYQGITGSLNLISTPSIAEFVLPSILSEFKTIYPSININVTTDSPDKFDEEIYKGEDILGFTGDKSYERNDIATIKIAEDKQVFITYPGHPLTLEKEITLSDLMGETLIIRGPGRFQLFLKGKGMDLDNYQPKIIMGSAMGVITAVEAKLGIGMISNEAIKNSEALGRVKVIQVKNFEGARSGYCVYRKDISRSTLTQGFLEFINNYSKSQGFSRVKHRI